MHRVVRGVTGSQSRRGAHTGVVGASAGGVEALTALARGLPAEFDAAVCVVIHLRACVESHLAQPVRVRIAFASLENRPDSEEPDGAILLLSAERSG